MLVERFALTFAVYCGIMSQFLNETFFYFFAKNGVLLDKIFSAKVESLHLPLLAKNRYVYGANIYVENFKLLAFLFGLKVFNTRARS